MASKRHRKRRLGNGLFELRNGDPSLSRVETATPAKPAWPSGMASDASARPISASESRSVAGAVLSLALGDDADDLARRNRLAGCDGEIDDDAVAVGRDLVLHLHRLD